MTAKGKRGVEAAQDGTVIADLFFLRNGRGKIYEIEFQDVLNLIDQGREGGLEFREGGILFRAGRGGDEDAQFSHP